MVVYVNTHAILDARRARARAAAAQGGDLEASQVRIPVSIYLVSHHRTIVGSIASLRICTRCRVLSYEKELQSESLPACRFCCIAWILYCGFHTLRDGQCKST